MADPASHSAAAVEIHRAKMTSPEAARPPLGLPAGSVRAVLAFVVLGLIWALMITQKEVPLYLQYLMFMILGHYYAARTAPSAAGAEAAPLYLPRGVVRTFIFLGFVGVFVSIWYNHRDNLDELLEELRSDTTRAKYLPLFLVAAFYLGLVMARVGRLLENRGHARGRLQDIQAWLSLVAVLALAAEVVCQFVINPTLPAERQIHLPHVENILAAIVGFYFGARS